MTDAPGVYFLGLPWQYRRGSALLLDVGRDAAYLAEQIVHAAAEPGRSDGTPQAAPSA
ncbi:putative oxidoreductase CzcO [compost metagenome]